MDEKPLTEARRTAERAVSDMAEGPLKIKAFEVILANLLAGRETTASGRKPSQRRPIRQTRKGTESPVRAQSLTGRIRTLRDEGFFRAQRTLSSVREELSSHGWHYPSTTLSGVMQRLVRNRELRRLRVKTATKAVWMYSNV